VGEESRWNWLADCVMAIAQITKGPAMPLKAAF